MRISSNITKQRGNQVMALLQSFQSGQVGKALQESINSAGSAQQEQDRWMESLDAKTKQFEASFQSLSLTVLNSDFLKFLVDSSTALSSGLDGVIKNFGVLSTVLTGAGITSFVKNYG